MFNDGLCLIIEHCTIGSQHHLYPFSYFYPLPPFSLLVPFLHSLLFISRLPLSLPVLLFSLSSHPPSLVHSLLFLISVLSFSSLFFLSPPSHA